jgi:hypothetical protein
MKIKTTGITFNQTDLGSETEFTEELTIEKYDLDRSSGFIIAQFDYSVEELSKLVFSVTLDGKKVDDYGTNLPEVNGDGKYVTTLFKWPNSAAANKIKKHKIVVKTGLVKGFTEASIEWNPAEALSESTFYVTLVRNKE